MRSATASTSRSLWVMKMIDLPWSTRLRTTLEELVDLARGEHGGGLVEDQDVGLPVERLDQLDALLLADREVADHGVGVDVEPVALAEARGSAARAASRSRTEPLARLVAEHDVLGDGEHRDELEVLVHHADAGGDGVGASCRSAPARPRSRISPASGW